VRRSKKHAASAHLLSISDSIITGSKFFCTSLQKNAFANRLGAQICTNRCAIDSFERPMTPRVIEFFGTRDASSRPTCGFDDPAPSSHRRSAACDYNPSLAFRISFTDCGLALPPDTFIT
jgi:hypothetical protein